MFTSSPSIRAPTGASPNLVPIDFLRSSSLGAMHFLLIRHVFSQLSGSVEVQCSNAFQTKIPPVSQLLKIASLLLGSSSLQGKATVRQMSYSVGASTCLNLPRSLDDLYNPSMFSNFHLNSQLRLHSLPFKVDLVPKLIKSPSQPR